MFNLKVLNYSETQLYIIIMLDSKPPLNVNHVILANFQTTCNSGQNRVRFFLQQATRNATL
jgi:hypothetical protein